MASNLVQRVGVAVVAVPLVILILYYRVPEATAALVFAATAIAMREFFAMTLTDPRDRNASLIIGLVSSAAIYLVHPRSLRYFDELRAAEHAVVALTVTGPIVALVLAVIPTGLYYLFRFRDMQTVAQRIAYTMTGVVYVGLCMMFLALCKRDFGPSGAD